MINFRLRLISKIIPLLAFMIVLRLFYWQIIRGNELTIEANRQRQDTVRLFAKRGEIFDVNNHVLAGTNNLYHLYAYKPSLTKDYREIAALLSEIIVKPSSATDTASLREENKENILNRLNLKSNWVSLKHFLDLEQKTDIENQKISGIGFEDEFIRYYPEASLSAHILGFVGRDENGQEKGYFGLEGFFDRELRGREGLLKVDRDALGRPILLGKYLNFEKVEGRSIITTIDRRIQYLAESVLASGLEKYQATAGGIIVMDSKTGKIKALASLPSYAPEKFSEFPTESFKNPNVASLYEPGSTFKVLVMAAALNEDLVTPETTCDICDQPINIGEFTIKTWNEEYHPNSTMTDVIKNSDNTGMVFVARKLGATLMQEYLRRFGFGQKTGIELEEEVTSRLKTDKEFREIDLATNAFGQGIAITPIQLITAVNAIANNGYLIKPTLVEKFIDNRQEINSQKTDRIQVFSSKTVSDITKIMITAVKAGEAKWAIPKNISIAGKTGTAQIPIEGHYDKEKTIASFIGFFPSEDPKFTILVTLREPKTSPWGSETAAPLWFSLAKNLIMF
jgi:cell division protein FtsI (penicillin-binding protein 3)/stage V sporulation protein D (sporulation-specific penicillin-binding protein)